MFLRPSTSCLLECTTMTAWCRTILNLTNCEKFRCGKYSSEITAEVGISSDVHVLNQQVGQRVHLGLFCVGMIHRPRTRRNAAAGHVFVGHGHRRLRCRILVWSLSLDPMLRTILPWHHDHRDLAKPWLAYSCRIWRHSGLVRRLSWQRHCYLPCRFWRPRRHHTRCIHNLARYRHRVAPHPFRSFLRRLSGVKTGRVFHHRRISVCVHARGQRHLTRPTKLCRHGRPVALSRCRFCGVKFRLLNRGAVGLPDSGSGRWTSETWVSCRRVPRSGSSYDGNINRLSRCGFRVDLITCSDAAVVVTIAGVDKAQLRTGVSHQLGSTSLKTTSNKNYILQRWNIHPTVAWLRNFRI